MEFGDSNVKGFVMGKKPKLVGDARMFSHYPPCIFGLKKRLDDEVKAINSGGRYQAPIRYVSAPHVLEIFVRRVGVDQALWLTHVQAKRLERSDAILPPPSRVQFH